MAKNILKELIVGFGFLNGIWLAIGIDPEDAIINYLAPRLSEISPFLQALFIILPALLLIGTIITIFTIYKRGGIVGSAAVLMAFIAGALILQNYIISIGLLLMALVLGYVSFRKRR